MANLPYNVAVPVLLHLLERFPSLRRGLVMVQAEVADRLAAPPGLAGLRRAVGEGRLVRRRRAAPGPSARTVFWPVPNVDSGLVALHRREPPATPAAAPEVFAVVDAAFAQRRKTLRAALAGWAGSPAAAEDGAARRRHRPAARAASRSAWPSSPGWRRTGPGPDLSVDAPWPR